MHALPARHTSQSSDGRHRSKSPLLQQPDDSSASSPVDQPKRRSVVIVGNLSGSKGGRRAPSEPSYFKRSPNTDPTSPQPLIPPPTTPQAQLSDDPASPAETVPATPAPMASPADEIQTPKSDAGRSPAGSVAPVVASPHGPGDFQHLNGGFNGIAADANVKTEGCSEVDPAEVTCMELSDSEAVGLETPTNPLQFLQRTGGAGGGVVDTGEADLDQYNIAREIALLRKEYTEQSRRLHERIAMVEDSTLPSEDQQREAHLNYLRKWMERVVNQVCRAHPAATDVTALLVDFQARLRTIVPEDYAEVMPEEEDDPNSPTYNIFSPTEMSPAAGNYNTTHTRQEKSSCCTVQ